MLPLCPPLFAASLVIAVIIVTWPVRTMLIVGFIPQIAVPVVHTTPVVLVMTPAWRIMEVMASWIITRRFVIVMVMYYDMMAMPVEDTEIKGRRFRKPELQ